MAYNVANVPLRNYSLTHSLNANLCQDDVNQRRAVSLRQLSVLSELGYAQCVSRQRK